MVIILQADKFARAYQQMQEFGFDNEKIKKALVSCDMDVQMALDQLV